VQVGEETVQLAPGAAAQASWPIGSSVLVRDDGPAPATVEAAEVAVGGD